MSQDPQRGGRNGAPPDLDEILRSLGNKLKQFFGGKPSMPRAPQPTDGRAVVGGVTAVAAVLAVLWIGSGFYVVEARDGEEAIVLRFGRYVETTGAGPHWRFPWPIGAHEIIKVQGTRSVEVGFKSDQKGVQRSESLMLTEDQNIIDMQLEVQYDIKDARAFVFNNNRVINSSKNSDPDAHDLVKQAAETAIREVVGKTKVDFVLNEGRGQVAAEATRLVQNLLDNYGTGIRVTRINISDVQPPEQVQDAFADVVKAGQYKVKQINEGIAYANEVEPRAKALAASLAFEAEGYKKSVIAKAQGDAARFAKVATEYAKAPQVTRDRMYLETMQQVLSNSSKVLVDQKSGSGNLLYLPLDKLMQLGSQPAPNATVTLTESPEAKAAEQATVKLKAESSGRGERDGR
ncbi:FtsH protease activity modulator HflK [Chitinimonas sp.]|uniref:FtsH protease activity modulator HflK n=1 Tax=Chitinimonas sp. TaxID=1934313 RepID=UPI0035B34CB6